MKLIGRLEDWSLVENGDVFNPQLRITGHLFGIHDPRYLDVFKDGDRVITNYIFHQTDTQVLTWSGSVYLLGKPSQEVYMTYSEAHTLVLREAGML